MPKFQDKGVESAATRWNAVLVTALPVPLSFMQRSPAETRRDGRFVVLALDHELRTAIVKTEHLVVDVQTVHDESKSVRQTYAALSVELEVRIEVVVTRGPIAGALIAGDVCCVIGKTNTSRG